MTQKEVADRMDVSQQVISRIERGDIGISFDRLIDLSRALDVRLLVLMNYEHLDDIVNISE